MITRRGSGVDANGKAGRSALNMVKMQFCIVPALLRWTRMEGRGTEGDEALGLVLRR